MRVVWITGRSGVGKTTVGTALRGLLAGDESATPVHLDGDALRKALGTNLGYDEPDRRALAHFYARLAKEIASQGHVVIVTTISLFHEVQAWNAANAPGYCEVLLRAPDHVLQARGGESSYLDKSGPQSEDAEFPLKPDLVIDNWGSTSPKMAAFTIIAHLSAQDV